MLPYQQNSVQVFESLLPKNTKTILEIGSDIPGLVVSSLAERSGALVVGINPSPDFPKCDNTISNKKTGYFVRSDGRFLPFPDNCFDFIISIATMEHVNGISELLQEVERVLKPKGIFYTNFAPIWSSAKGHHVFAIAGEKEARFWKLGKNPVPDFAHLYMTPEELREILSTGPCSSTLIEPIINWIYFDDAINRYHYDTYIDEFSKSTLLIERLITKSLNNISPDSETIKKLNEKYGEKCNFSTSGITAIFRKSNIKANKFAFVYFKYSIVTKRYLHWFIYYIAFKILTRFPEMKPLAETIMNNIRHIRK